MESDSNDWISTCTLELIQSLQQAAGHCKLRAPSGPQTMRNAEHLCLCICAVQQSSYLALESLAAFACKAMPYRCFQLGYVILHRT